MAEDQNIHIVSWPQNRPVSRTSSIQKHPCPVVLSFDDCPARVIVATDRGAHWTSI